MCDQFVAEQLVAAFLRTEYSDEALAALLAHAEDGKLAFWSCCCFAGVPTATHALRGEFRGGYDLSEHITHPDFKLVRRREMSDAYGFLAETDDVRRAKLIPLIRAEIERRERERSKSSSPMEYQTVSV